MSIGKSKRGGLAARSSGFKKHQRTSDRIRQSTNTSVNHYTSNWSEIRRAVLERDSYTCRRCKVSSLPGEYSNVVLTVDHIIPIARGGRTILPNLMTLCSDCHAKKLGKANKRGSKLLEGSAKRIRDQRNARRLKN